ncbi:hypothetical protein POM88_034057 [Heracleum sosnowskyi]|uniref:Replication factor A C-terminal domain-containing protein n=1 Tax=Heracleum sosnowskyi TaxID=360622 RepID=A0AAD8MA75_9APIA|nr:hypothetical protein POM88_034057 [Heracleum sosnowskyi]
MSAKRVDPITSLKPGRYDYRIKVRVIRKWRGSTKEGEVFKAFNIVLLDNMTYLTDVVGIVKKYEFLDLTNKLGKDKKQAKFIITDGSSNVKVIFWDKYSENFDKAMNEQVEKPVIVILSACKAGLWNDEVELSNVSATKYYLNYNHHSVLQLRKRMNQPKFVDIAMATTETRKIEQLKINQITKLGKEYIKSQVMLLVQIKSVVDTQSWFMHTCTTCDHETELNNGIFICKNCPRTVPHPDTKYKIHVIASDDTSDLEVIMHDREVRTLIGRRARDVFDEQSNIHALPTCLKNLAKKNYTVMLRIREENVVDHFQVYWTTNICNGFTSEQQQTMENNNDRPQSSSQATYSTYQEQRASSGNM